MPVHKSHRRRFVAFAFDSLIELPGDLDVNFLYTLNSTGLGFTVDDFDDAEEVTDKILGEIDISCPPSP